MHQKKTGLIIAAAVSTLFVTASFAADTATNASNNQSTATAAPNQVMASNECSGVNSCAGKKDKKSKKSDKSDKSDKETNASTQDD